MITSVDTTFDSLENSCQLEVRRSKWMITINKSAKIPTVNALDHQYLGSLPPAAFQDAAYPPIAIAAIQTRNEVTSNAALEFKPCAVPVTNKNNKTKSMNTALTAHPNEPARTFVLAASRISGGGSVESVAGGS